MKAGHLETQRHDVLSGYNGSGFMKMATIISRMNHTKPHKITVLWALFFVFLKIGAFTWGGGYSMLPLIRCELVEKRKWMSPDAFIDGVAISESIPGALAVNTATYVGHMIAGDSGALVAALGAVLPSFMTIIAVVVLLSHFREYKVVQNFFKGANPAIVALLASAVIDLGRSVIKKRRDILITLGLISLLVFLKMHPVLIILIAAVFGLFFREGKVE